MKRGAVPGIPFAFSLLLSALTVGSHAYWQDSGYYLTAVRDLSVLYPHGFVLYIVLCKGWTLIAEPIFAFARSVYLFSSLMAAAGAAFAALASRDFLRKLDPSKPADLPAIGAGCILAGGYCWGHAAIIAKTYALSYALLALLLWLLVRSERRRDFVALGAVLGLSWAAHPAAALLVPGLLLYGWARRNLIREWGWAFFAGIVVLAAACAFLPCLLIFVFAARESLSDFGNPHTLCELISYVSGERFTRQEEAFGFSAWRWVAGLRYAWEEYLLGLIPLVLGMGILVRRHRPAAILLGGWVVPVLFITLIFQGEGQFDQWLVFVYIPLALATAVGLSVLQDRGARTVGGMIAAACVTLAAVNVPILSQKDYVWAEMYARLLMKNLEPGSVLLLSRDDQLGGCRYLQGLPGERTDVLTFSSTLLGEEWLDRRIAQRTGLQIPNYAFYRTMAKNPALWEMVGISAFANENVGRVPAVYSDLQPSREFLKPELGVVQAGMLWRIAPKADAVPDLKYWDYPVNPEDIPRKGRARGHWSYVTAEGTEMQPELYEDRLFLPLLWARVRMADLYLRQDPAKALGLYESVRRAYRDAVKDPRFAYHLGLAYYTTGKGSEAGPLWQDLLAQRPPPEIAVYVHFYLGELHLEARRAPLAVQHYRRALELSPPPDLEKVLQARLQGR